jgi:hypothetical protein
MAQTGKGKKKKKKEGRKEQEHCENCIEHQILVR